MPSFAINVVEMFSELTTDHRFVPANAIASRNFVSFVRYETDDVFVYVFVRDGRTGGADVDVSIWIAPPDEPGDGLDKLYVGFKVRIGAEYEIDDEFFLGCQERIVRLLPCVSAMVPIIQAELENPSYRTKRWHCYRFEQDVLRALLSVAKSGEHTCTLALEKARRAARGKPTRKRLEVACLEAAQTLVATRTLGSDVLHHFEGNASYIAHGLLGAVYSRALGEVSKELGIKHQT